LAIGRRTSVAFCALFLLLSSFAAPAQQGATSESISVNYVLVPFVPLDSRGRPIRSLTSREVRLVIDGVPARFDMFEESNDAPVSYTILLDVSGSMQLAGKMAGARTAVNALLASSGPQDDYSLWTFADGEVEEIVPFTQNEREILRALFNVEPYGKTAFRDALAKMPDKTILGRNGSRAIILLTDALDNASSITRKELTQILESVDVPIYPLGLRPHSVQVGAAPSPESLTDIELLNELARVSGGRSVISNDLRELESSVHEIQQDLHSQYVLGFSPTGRGQIRFRRIAVEISGRRRSARVRAGYRGTEPPRIAESAKPKSRPKTQRGDV
jgi:Ca-activated chloride channel family protein